MWEDEANINGGKWIVRLKKGVAARYWEEIVREPVRSQPHSTTDIVLACAMRAALEQSTSGASQPLWRNPPRASGCLHHWIYAPPSLPIPHHGSRKCCAASLFRISSLTPHLPPFLAGAAARAGGRAIQKRRRDLWDSAVDPVPGGPALAME
eukprot:scaffold11693_cov115-Isochrysis_galbana.AAC.8